MHKPVVVPGIPSVKWDQVRETCVLREKLCSVVGWRAVWSACLYCPQNQTQLQNQMLSLLGESVKKMLRKHIKDHDKDYHTVHLRRVRLTLLDSHGCYKLGRLVTNCRLLLGPKAIISEGQLSLWWTGKFKVTQSWMTKLTPWVYVPGHLKIASDQKNKVSYQRLIPVQVLWKRPWSKSH